MDGRIPEKVDSKFRYVLVSARRAEQLIRGGRPRLNEAGKPTTVAMEEITRELRDTQAKLLEVIPKLANAKAVLGRMEIRAPYSGRVVALDNGRDALRMLEQVPLGAAVVDLMMPDMDGLDLTEAIDRTTRGRLPVVILTALDSDEAYYEGCSRGARYFLTKSGDPRPLADVLDYVAGELDEEERELLRAKLEG